MRITRNQRNIGWLLLALWIVGCDVITVSKNFNKLKVGMTRSQVEQIMGKPRKILEGVPCKGFWEKPCKEAKSKPIKTFLSWKAGIDDLFVVGLDVNDKVIFLANEEV